MLNESANDSDVHNVCDGSHLTCYAEGHPDEGGIPFVELSATDEELEDLLMSNSGKVDCS